MKRVKFLEAGLQRQNVLRGQSGARKRRSRRHKPDGEDAELLDCEDEESYEEPASDGKDEWLP